MRKTGFLLRVSCSLLVALALAGNVAAQKKDEEKAPPPTGIDAATGKILTEAIEALNKENYAGAKAAVAKLKLDALSPYERSRTEQILATIESSRDNYGGAQKHLQAAIDAGGLNEKEVSDTRYQIAQMFLAQEKWKEGAAALEQWFQTAPNPNSAAYYLLAVAYYQQNDYKRAIVPAQKAVDLAEKPQESWVQLVLALYLQQDQYAQAVPLLKRLINMAPEKKTYWQQLSSVYGQMEDYPKSLAVAQIAYNGGILTDDSDVRRLADLQLFNDAPYRCGETIERGDPEEAGQGRLQALREAGELLDCRARVREGDRSAAARRRDGFQRGPVRAPRRSADPAQRMGRGRDGAAERAAQGRAEGHGQCAAAARHCPVQPEELRGRAGFVHACTQFRETPQDG